MPKQATKANGKQFKAVKRRNTRAAHYAQRRRAVEGDPLGLLRLACDQITAVAARPKTNQVRVGELTESVLAQARHIAELGDASPASVAHNEAELSRASTARGRLAAALRWLRTGVSTLPDDDRERYAAHYAQQLEAEAGELAPR